MKKSFLNYSAVKYIFSVLAIIIFLLSIFFSSNLVGEMAKEERQKMEIWADATRQIATAGDDFDFTFCLRVIQDNNSIPVVIVDADGYPYQYRNIDIPDKYNGEPDSTFLMSKVESFMTINEPIEIKLDDTTFHKLYYGDSLLLQKLSYFPVVQWGLIFLFFIALLLVLASVRKAEQDRVWVGLSKETAHQLGTPISSLMAWVELLKGMDVDASVAQEIGKDVNRLQTIANRFSKIGSKPECTPVALNEVIDNALSYMRGRVSRRVNITCHYEKELPYNAELNVPLFEWVIENLCKNAIDAMDGNGSIHVEVSENDSKYIVDVSDTGKGIPKSKFKTVFEPGFTTKSRGWGLGLSLAKRIMEEYHHGKIYVLNSTQGVGTTFRIEVKKGV
ncbi:MAG: HAMP domain-containing histidine kinase [Bacteroidales bacterium]|nr:HAMP domain-containing histidine kinase [Candidatus Scybalocola fimicaballi]